MSFLQLVYAGRHFNLLSALHLEAALSQTLDSGKNGTVNGSILRSPPLSSLLARRDSAYMRLADVTVQCTRKQAYGYAVLSEEP